MILLIFYFELLLKSAIILVFVFGIVIKIYNIFNIWYFQLIPDNMIGPGFLWNAGGNCFPQEVENNPPSGSIAVLQPSAVTKGPWTEKTLGANEALIFRLLCLEFDIFWF